MSVGFDFQFSARISSQDDFDSFTAISPAEAARLSLLSQQAQSSPPISQEAVASEAVASEAVASEVVASEADPSPPVTPPLPAVTEPNTIEPPQAPSRAAQLPKWHYLPRHLKRRSLHNMVIAVGDIAMGITPVLFLVLGGCAASLNGKAISNNEFGRNVERALLICTSLFPIFFSAAAGRALVSIAHFFAERGTKLGNLDLLIACQTVWRTIQSPFLFQNCSILVLLLLVFWALSPVGSQASLRVLDHDSSIRTASDRVVYLPTGGMSRFQLDQGVFAGGANSPAVAATDALYNAALLAPAAIKTSPHDPWGHVKIPWLEQLDNSKADSEGWIPISGLNSPDNYSSLVGLPVAGIPSSTESQFNVTSAYMTLDCSDSVDVDKSGGDWRNVLGELWGPTKGAIAFRNVETRKQVSFFLDTHLPINVSSRLDALFQNQSDTSEDAILTESRNIFFGSQYILDGASTMVSLRNCSLQQRYVDSIVVCLNSTCSVDRMRESVQYSQRNPNLTPLDHPRIVNQTLRHFPRTSGRLHFGYMSPAELFINGSMNPFLMTPVESTPLKVSRQIFSRRLAVLLNTYYQFSLAPSAFAGPLPAVSAFGPFGNSTLGNGSVIEDALFSGVPADISIGASYDVYRCNVIWLIFLLLSAALLLALSTFGMVLRWRCHARDMLGYVASMTYDNPHISLPPGGGAMGAVERSQALRKLRVRIGDVTPQEDVGHVALASVEEGQAEVGKLSRNRMYL